MSKLGSIKGFVKTFWNMIKEDWIEMDHKLLRIVGGIIAFALMALFWLYFFSNSSPFRIFA